MNINHNFRGGENKIYMSDVHCLQKLLCSIFINIQLRQCHVKQCDWSMTFHYNNGWVTLHVNM